MKKMKLWVSMGALALALGGAVPASRVVRAQEQQPWGPTTQEEAAIASYAVLAAMQAELAWLAHLVEKQQQCVCGNPG